MGVKFDTTFKQCIIDEHSIRQAGGLGCGFERFVLTNSNLYFCYVQIQTVPFVLTIACVVANA
jgi:hypothetical protein